MDSNVPGHAASLSVSQCNHPFNQTTLRSNWLDLGGGAQENKVKTWICRIPQFAMGKDRRKASKCKELHYGFSVVGVEGKQ